MVRDVARREAEPIPPTRPQPTTSPSPETSGRLDRILYRSVYFYGVALSGPLAAAADYLRCWEDAHGRAPHVLCVHDEFSAEDEGSDLAWKVTLVLGEPDGELAW
jgi:hypothetical protein